MKLKILLDFDGTVVEHSFPKMGRCNFGCFEVIKKLQDAGHEIILNTYRSNIDPGYAAEALHMINEHHWRFVKDRSMGREFKIIPIVAIEGKIDPNRFSIEDAIKCGILFIDDNATDTPLKPAVMSAGRMVDWDALDVLFEKNGFYVKNKET